MFLGWNLDKAVSVSDRGETVLVLDGREYADARAERDWHGGNRPNGVYVISDVARRDNQTAFWGMLIHPL